MYKIGYKQKHKLGFFGNPDFDVIGSVSGYKCYLEREEDTLWIEFVDPDYVDRKGRAKRVCAVTLAETKRGVYEVELTLMDTEYQGYNLAPRFYAFLLRKLAITLKAGTSQSPGGRSIWKRLAKRRDVLIYGKTPAGRPAMMIEEEGELQPVHGRFEAYDGEREFEMYAVRAV